MRKKLATSCLVSCLVAGGVVLAWGAYLPAKAALSQILLARAYTKASQSNLPQKPWSWADTKVVARLQLPDQPALIVLQGNTGQALAFAPSLLEGSRPAHRVIAAHRDTHFNGLGTLQTGAQISLSLIDGSGGTYQVTGAKVLKAGAINLPIVAGEQFLSLVTCWPLDALNPNTPDRYVVTAKRI